MYSRPVLAETFARLIERVDELDIAPHVNRRTGAYLPGVKSLTEVTLVDALAPLLPARTQVPYPSSTALCDLVTTDTAIELKWLQLVGDNGKRNDFATAKALSPFPKDRSLVHDASRIRSFPSQRHAVVAVSFTYTGESCDRAAALHPQHHERIDNVAKVCRDNGGELSPLPLVRLIDAALDLPHSHAPFSAWRHPCGGDGSVFVWELPSVTGDVVIHA